jgi:hypothetical protein
MWKELRVIHMKYLVACFDMNRQKSSLRTRLTDDAAAILSFWRLSHK